MSSTQIIACDYPLPPANTESMRIVHRFYPHGKYGDGTDQADAYIKKPYKYSITLKADETCAAIFRTYLYEHLKEAGNVELWNIWLGSGFKDYGKYMLKLKNISTNEYAEIYDAVDMYIDSLPAPVNRKCISIYELTGDIISFFNRTHYACITVRK